MFVLWQSLVVRSYRTFFHRLAQHAPWRLALAAPRKFRELGNQDIQCDPFDPPFRANDKTHAAFVLPSLNLHVQVVLFWRLARSLHSFFGRDRISSGHKREHKIVVCVAEPYSVTALLAWLTARIAAGRDFLFICYTAQNIVKKLAWPLRVIQSFLFKHSFAILSVGSEQKSVLREQGFTGTMVEFPLWYDSAAFQPATHRSGKVVIGFAGSLTEAKGILDLLRCLELMDESASLCELRIAGDGPLRGEVTAGAARLESRGWNVEVLGGLPANRMSHFFSGLDILVVPSRTKAHWKEQFGRVIIEAKACGVLVLGSNSGEIPRVIGDDAKIFDEASVDSMKTVLERWIRILGNPDQRQAVRQAEAEHAASSFSDIVLANRFQGTINDLILKYDRLKNSES